MVVRDALISLTKAVVVTITIIAMALLTAVAATALVGLSKELATVVVVAGIVISMGLVMIATAEI
jgi:carbon starvation protein CstA